MDVRGKKILFYRRKRAHTFRRLIGCQNLLLVDVLPCPVEEKSTVMTWMDFSFSSPCSVFAFSVFHGRYFSFSSSSLFHLFKTDTHVFLFVFPLLLFVSFLLPLRTAHLPLVFHPDACICSVAWSVPICNTRAWISSLLAMAQSRNGSTHQSESSVKWVQTWLNKN